MSESIHQDNTDHFKEVEFLLLDSVNPDFSEADRERLNSLLRDSANARAFASELLFDDALLADSLSAEAAEASFREKASSRQNRTVWIRIAAVVVICLIPLSWILSRQGSPQKIETTVASIQGTNRISGLNHGQTFQVGERVEMERGRAVLRFASGAKFAIEAPASFVITGPNGADLDVGRATVRVPGEIKGFTLVTPTEKIVDLGTAFGIEVAQNGTTSVAVFEGEVELLGASQSRRIFAGQSTQSIQPKLPAQSIPHLVDAFLNTWETSFGVESVSGDLRVSRPGERLAPGRVIDSSSLLLFPERENVTLPEGYALNSTRTGLHQYPFRSQIEYLTESLTVDSYLLQYHPGVKTSSSKDRVFTAELHFDRPVVGLILRPDQLDASDDLLAMPGAQLKNINRRGINKDDQVELSEDRRILYIRMSIQDSVDQIRVLVEASG